MDVSEVVEQFVAADENKNQIGEALETRRRENLRATSDCGRSGDAGWRNLYQ